MTRIAEFFDPHFRAHVCINRFRRISMKNDLFPGRGRDERALIDFKLFIRVSVSVVNYGVLSSTEGPARAPEKS